MIQINSKIKINLVIFLIIKNIKKPFFIILKKNNSEIVYSFYKNFKTLLDFKILNYMSKFFINFKILKKFINVKNYRNNIFIKNIKNNINTDINTPNIFNFSKKKNYFFKNSVHNNFIKTPPAITNFFFKFNTIKLNLYILDSKVKNIHSNNIYINSIKKYALNVKINLFIFIKTKSKKPPYKNSNNELGSIKIFKKKFVKSNYFEKLCCLNAISYLKITPKVYFKNYKIKQIKSKTLKVSYHFKHVNFKSENIYSFKIKKQNLKINYFKNYLIFILDFYSLNFVDKVYKNINIFSNKYLIKTFNLFSIEYLKLNKKSWLEKTIKNFNNFNNYYPLILFGKKTYNSFFLKFNQSYNLNYIHLNNKIIINFLENFLKKKIFLRVTNNYYNVLTNYYFDKLINEYKNYQPHYWKNFLFLDFLEILWYSFLLRDLNMISEWISKFMESLNFKNHKKFLSFLYNFLNKYSGLFMDTLSVKGFFFDIRGKVGVTGSSKKRHFVVKFGSLNKSSKEHKININQSLVRTYSGVLGLTYILSY